MQVRSLGGEDLLEKEMATHSSILAWRIPRTEEPGGLRPMESQRAGHNGATKHTASAQWCAWVILKLPPHPRPQELSSIKLGPGAKRAGDRFLGERRSAMKSRSPSLVSACGDLGQAVCPHPWFCGEKGGLRGISSSIIKLKPHKPNIKNVLVPWTVFLPGA